MSLQSSIRWAKPFLCLVICFVLLGTQAAVARTVTLDDAFDIRSVGGLDLNRNAELLAFEEGGSIVVISLRDRHELLRMPGSSPSWSPDGRKLAFLTRETKPQAAVWDRTSGRAESVTQIEGGISQPLQFACVNGLSWSPDSTQLVFATRLMGEEQNGESASREQSGRRIYGPDITPNTAIIEGVFSRQSYWDTYYPSNPNLGTRMRAVDRDPALGMSHLVIANILTKTWRNISNNDVSCPSWSPDGRYIAAVANTDTGYHPTFYGHTQLNATTLSILDLQTQRQILGDVPAKRIGTPCWTPDARYVLFMGEAGRYISSFTRAMAYERTTAQVRTAPPPEGLPLREIRCSSSGTLAVTYDHFADSVWSLDVESLGWHRLDTRGHHINWSSHSVDIDGNGDLIANLETARSTGRVFEIDQWAGGRSRLLYDANPQLAQLTFGEQRRVSWRNSTGDRLDGIVILPPGYTRGRRYPVIVDAYPRPAWDNLNLAPRYEFPGQLQATWGYVIFKMQIRAPQATYALTMSSGEAFNERARGAAGIPMMVDDFESGIDYLVSQGIADPNRIGIFGHSNGGWTANILITESSRIRAAVIASGVSNAVLAAFFPFQRITRGADPATNGNVFDNVNDYIRLSPIFKMRDVNIPMLLTVGDQDWFWVPQMISEYAVLRSEGRDVGLVRYADEAHTLTRREDIEDALTRMRAFFDRHLKNAG